jgi:hypothetical protein
MRVSMAYIKVIMCTQTFYMQRCRVDTLLRNVLSYFLLLKQLRYIVITAQINRYMVTQHTMYKELK